MLPTRRLRVHLQVPASLCMYSTCEFAHVSSLLTTRESHARSSTTLVSDFACHTSHTYLFVNLRLSAIVGRRKQKRDGKESNSRNSQVLCATVVAIHVYFVKQGLSNAYHASIDMCADKVFQRTSSKMRQTTLDSFMLHVQCIMNL